MTAKLYETFVQKVSKFDKLKLKFQFALNNSFKSTKAS